jgi:pyruvate dehydrogenase (quinone)
VAQLASEALIERLIDWGVDTVFGLPGDGINGIMEGLRRNQDKVRFVLVHHEEAAAFMATAHAKATGRIGVCLATSGPGGIHLLNGLYDAKLDHMPVLAITGMQETSVLGTGYQQEVALDRLYADVAEYDQLIINPRPALVDVNVNPNEPPLPGKVEYEQAKNFALAFLRGQPKRVTIATTMLKDRISELRSGNG